MGQRKHGAFGSTFSTVLGSCANADVPINAASTTNRPRRVEVRADTRYLRTGDRAAFGRTAAHRLASVVMARIPSMKALFAPAAAALVAASLACPGALHATCAPVPKAPIDADSPADVLDQPARA